MALIKCPECGKSISDKATTCIHCGYPIKELGISKPSDEKDLSEKAEKHQISEQTECIDDICIVNVPKEKYIKWLLIICMATFLIISIISMIINSYYSWLSLVILLVTSAIPGLALLYNAKRKPTPARILAIIYAVWCCISAVINIQNIRSSDVFPVLTAVYLVLYVFQNEQKQDSVLWFILGLIVVTLYDILSMILGWDYSNNLIFVALFRIILIFGWTYFLVGFSPDKWFRKYTIKKSTKKMVLIGRIAAFGFGIIAVIIQIVGSTGVSTKEYQDALWTYNTSAYSRPMEHTAAEKYLVPLTEKYYRDNTISIIIACMAFVVFIATLYIVHKKKHICEE